MNRRGFLSLLGMTVGGLALEQAIPFNRVWSFPSKIVVPANGFLTPECVSMEVLRILKKNLKVSSVLNREYEKDFAFINGDTWGSEISVRIPQRFTSKCSEPFRFYS